MVGLKRKIDIKKIAKKDPRAVTFSKRRKGLYSKASDLCLLSDAQMVILATPVSSNSHASFYSFGHSSVDSVVEAFLTDQTPPRDDYEKLGFWWEDESLANSENPEELGEALGSMTMMLHDLKELVKRRDRVDVKKEKGVSHVTCQEPTLIHQPCSSSLCVDDQDDLTVNVQGFHNNNEEQAHSEAVVDGDQLVVITNRDLCDNNIHLSDLDEHQILAISDNTNEEQTHSEAVVDGDQLVETNRDLCDNNIHLSDLDEDQILAISDNNNNNNNNKNNVLPEDLSWFNEELDIDQLIDYEMNLEMDGETKQSMFSVSETVEEGGVSHKDLDEDNLCFSDYFNGLTSVAAL
ncbi:agamous-like MADS-box protein AGL97 [Capsella rubella]|uniref:agamous-like MADS-box protein AGL97 n=1 Tax=Capsella rubella TaxID=81985 RepID=UPI000CD5609B|nr:agamous-like MADS-box protein AGL97 [Capsella rubella]